MKKAIVIIISSLLVFTVVSTAVTGVIMFDKTSQLVTNEQTVGYGKEFPGKNKIEKSSITSSFDDHHIPFDYIYAKDIDSMDNKTVIIVHGLSGNRHTVNHMAAFFTEHGYNVIAYDQRSHGENTAEYTTYGYYEREDLADLVSFVREKTGKAIGLWGWSYGGITVGLSLDKKVVSENVSFAVMESPVSSMEGIIKYELEKMDTAVPVSYLLFAGNIVNKIKLGFTYGDADLTKQIADTEVPVLIINTKADQIVPYPMGTDVFDAIRGENKEIMTVDDSKHTEIWDDHREEYKEKIENFIERFAHPKRKGLPV